MKRPRMPSADDMHIAAQWLDIYEGEEDAEDAKACRRVREYLLWRAYLAEFAGACRAAGVTASRARAAARTKGVTK